MKTPNLTRPILLAALLGSFALSLPKFLNPLQAADKPAGVAVPSQLDQAMIGAWVHVGSPGKESTPPEKGKRIKFRTGSHWTLTRAHPETGLVVEHFGGNYTLHGNEYVETQVYGDATWMKDNGKSFKFTVKVEGDTMTQIGIGNPHTEVWKRMK